MLTLAVMTVGCYGHTVGVNRNDILAIDCICRGFDFIAEVNEFADKLRGKPYICHLFIQFKLVHSE